MKFAPLIAATALATVLSSQAFAASIAITGQGLTPGLQGPANVTYPNGNPTFTGTYDDVANTLLFTWDAPYVTNINVFNGFYVANITTQNNGFVSFSTNPLGGPITNTNTSSCAGAPEICNAAGGTVTLSGFTYNGSTGTFQQSIAGSNGTTITNFTFAGSAPEVPLPAAAWLFGSALLGLVGIGRRRAK